MSQPHDPNHHEPEPNPQDGAIPEDFDLLAEDDPSGEVFIDLTEAEPVVEHEQTLNLSEVHDEPPQVQKIEPVQIPDDEPQSMILEPDPEFDLDLQVLEEGTEGEGAVAFDLPAADHPEEGAVTRGVSREDLDFLMEEVPQADPASFVGHEATESEAADIGEAVPIAEAASGVSGFIPDAEPASFAGLPDGTVAEAADFGEAVPMADSASGPIPDAEAAEPAQAASEEKTVFESPLWAEAAGSVPEIILPDILPDITPVQPVSAWFHSGEKPTEMAAQGAPSAGDGDIFDAPRPVGLEGSDIFGWRHAERGTAAEAPRDDESRPAPAASIRPSGDSARHEKRGAPLEDEIDAAGMPRASDDASSILDELGGSNPVFNIDGSEVRLEDPGVDRTLSDDDALPEFDLDPGLPTFNQGDDPAIELLADTPEASESPAFGEDLAGASDGSAVPVERKPTPSSSGRPEDWFASPGSDLFAERKSPEPHDPLAGESGRVNPFDDDLNADQPSLASAASSIFTGDKTPGGADSVAGGSASVRIGHNDEEQTVFGDSIEADENASHILGAAAARREPKPGSDSTQEDEAEVDWLASNPGEVADAYDDLRDAPASGVFSKTKLPPVQGSPSSIFSKSKLDPASQKRERDITQKMDSTGNLLDDVYGEMQTPKAEPKPGAKEPTPAPVEVEVDWLASTDEPEAMKPADAAIPAFAMADSDSAPSLSQDSDSSIDDSSIHDDSQEKPMPRKEREKAKSGGGGMLVGGLAGMLGGIALGAGVYFSGLVPNSEKTEAPPPVQVAKVNPKTEAELDELRKELAAVKEEADDKVAKAAASAEKASQELARALEDKVGVDALLTEAKNKVTDLEKTVTTAKADQTKAETAAKDATDKLATVQTDLTKAEATAKDATDKLAAAQKAATDAMTTAATSDAAAKKATDDLAKAMKALDGMKDTRTKIDDAINSLAREQTKVKQLEDQLAGITKELQAGKLLPADAVDPTKIAAAVKDAVAKANATPGTPPPAGMTAAELQALKDSVAKSEAAAKAATEKLATETAAIKADYTAQMDTLKKAHADEVKKLSAASPDIAKIQEAAAAAIKKAQDDAAAAMKKAEDATAIEVKKATEAKDAELKKAKEDANLAMKTLTDKLMTDMTKLKSDYDAKLAVAEKKGTDDLAKIQAELAAAKADLAGVMTPSQTLDLWLPLLAEARRPADADAAAANAEKVLATAAPGTEAFAKAQTLKGLALHIKGDDAAARAAFEAAKKDPSFAAAKPWAKFAEEGSASAVDPVGKFRKPVDPERKDPRAALRFLDEGIRFYSARRYADAEKLLTQAVQHDSGSPVAWYYLGAARWQTGKRDAAKDDFRQGAEREVLHTMSAANVEQAIAPIQGPVRAAIADVRP